MSDTVSPLIAAHPIVALCLAWAFGFLVAVIAMLITAWVMEPEPDVSFYPEAERE